MSQRTEVLEVAAVGHRITHEDLPPPRSIMVRVVRALSQTPRPSGGRVAVDVARAITVLSMGELEGEDPGETPDPCGVIEQGSIDTFIGKDKLPVALADEEVAIPCEDHSDGPILTGAKTVFVNGKPLARRTDELDCGAFIGEGDPTVFVSLPSTERVVKQAGGGIIRGPLGGALAGRDMQRLQQIGVRVGRALAGGRESQGPKRRVTREARAAAVGRQLTQRDTVGLLRMLTLRP